MKPGFWLQAVRLAMLFAVGGFLMAILFAFYIWSILFGFVDCQPDLIWFDDRQTNLIQFVDANPILFCLTTSKPILFGLTTAKPILFGLLMPTQSYSGLTTAKPVLFLFAGRQTTISMIKFPIFSSRHLSSVARAIDTISDRPHTKLSSVSSIPGLGYFFSSYFSFSFSYYWVG